jgi:hypothetical protein
MNTLFKSAIIGILLSVCFSVTAQEQIYSTIKDTFFSLTAIVQKPGGGTDTVRITNKDILSALNAAGAFNFGPDAKLLLRSVNGGLPSFIVRESTTNEVTTTDVSAYLTLAEPGYAVHVHDSMLNWGIWNYTLNDGDGTDFTFWGFTTLHSGAIPAGNSGDLLRTVKLISIGSGPGEIHGANAQFSGKVTADHGRLDLSSTNSAPPL